MKSLELCSPSRPSVFGLLPEELAVLGLPRQAESLFRSLHRFDRWEASGPVLGKGTRRLLEQCAKLDLPEIIREARSRDGSLKCLLQALDGACYESVAMPRETRNPRVTLCLSSQAGCALACRFCRTGQMGCQRSLTAAELVAQILFMAARIGPTRPHLLNLVFMGMGEPLLNMENLQKALRILSHPAGLGLPFRRILVSTSGVAPGIRAMAQWEHRPLLALSLNAVDDGLRSRLMPVNQRWPLAELHSALTSWRPNKGERLIFEYILLPEINDSLEQARALSAWIADFPHTLNLIPFNPWPGAEFRAPLDSEIEAFYRQLIQEGSFVTIRRSRGEDISAACGQLAGARPGL